MVYEILCNFNREFCLLDSLHILNEMRYKKISSNIESLSTWFMWVWWGYREGPKNLWRWVSEYFITFIIRISRVAVWKFMIIVKANFPPQHFQMRKSPKQEGNLILNLVICSHQRCKIIIFISRHLFVVRFCYCSPNRKYCKIPTKQAGSYGRHHHHQQEFLSWFISHCFYHCYLSGERPTTLAADWLIDLVVQELWRHSIVANSWCV